MPTRISYVADDEPVSVAAVKLAARIDTDVLDGQLASWITAAREAAEHLTQRCFRLQVQREELPDWPAPTRAIAVNAASACVVRYWGAGGWTLLDPSAYVYAPGGIGNNGTVLAPATDTNWPTLAARPVGPRVRIDLTAGPSDDTPPVPEQVKLYIVASVAAWVKTPEATAGAAMVHNPMFAPMLDGATLHGF